MSAIRADGSVATLCRLCGVNCGVWVNPDGDIVDGVSDHPASRGRVCRRARLVRAVMKSPDRLLHPLAKHGDSWQRITWDEALATITDRIAGACATGEARSVAAYLGEAVGHHELRQYARRMFNLIGSPNLSSCSAECFDVRDMAARAVFGRMPFPDLETAGVIVVWGANPDHTQPWTASAIRAAVRRGAKLIVIDPRRTRLARSAALHLRPFPGTDGALALGICRLGLDSDLIDRGHIDRCFAGELEPVVGPYVPEAVSCATGVGLGDLETAARSLTREGPVACVLGNGLEHNESAFDGIRAIYILLAACGAVGPAGAMRFATAPPVVDIKKDDDLTNGVVRIGEAEHPLYCRWIREAQGMRFADAILSGSPYPLRTLIVQGSNPVLTWPDTPRVVEALRKLDLLVVMDMFMTETAQLADIVLPAASFLERWGYHIYPEYQWVSLRRPVQNPPGECRPDWRLWFDLAKALGYGREFAWASNVDAVRLMFDRMPFSLSELEDSATGLSYDANADREGCMTPSGLIEPWCEDASGQANAAPQPPLSGPSSGLVLITGVRSPVHVHSRYQRIPDLLALDPTVSLLVHPHDADRRQLHDGDRASLSTASGSVEVGITVSDDIIPGVVSIPHGWPESNVNAVTGAAGADGPSGFPAVKAIACDLDRVPAGD